MELPRPKYWTGRMLGRWPVYVSDREKAWPIETREQAEEIRLRFPDCFGWEIVPA